MPKMEKKGKKEKGGLNQRPWAISLNFKPINLIGFTYCSTLNEIICITELRVSLLHKQLC